MYAKMGVWGRISALPLLFLSARGFTSASGPPMPLELSRKSGPGIWVIEASPVRVRPGAWQPAPFAVANLDRPLVKPPHNPGIGV